MAIVYRHKKYLFTGTNEALAKNPDFAKRDTIKRVYVDEKKEAKTTKKEKGGAKKKSTKKAK